MWRVDVRLKSFQLNRLKAYKPNSTIDNTSSRAFKLNLAASLLLPSIVPFTVAFMKPVNDKLIERMEMLASASLEDKTIEVGVREEETTKALIDRWATLNMVRAVPIVVGTVCAVLAAVDK